LLDGPKRFFKIKMATKLIKDIIAACGEYTYTDEVKRLGSTYTYT
jgi:hypothetical protein